MSQAWLGLSAKPRTPLSPGCSGGSSHPWFSGGRAGRGREKCGDTAPKPWYPQDGNLQALRPSRVLAAELLCPLLLLVLTHHLPEIPRRCDCRGRESTPLKLLTYAGLGLLSSCCSHPWFKLTWPLPEYSCWGQHSAVQGGGAGTVPL